jgi:ABC-type branched-subunit amino acid transport system ATPase component/ABC-type branched-subunit amino acid transport system permease subunit
MTEVFRYALLGLGVGAVYTLLSQGLILIYRGSGVLNFAQGAYAMTGAYLFWELNDQHHNSFAVAFVVAVVGVGLLGAATHLLIMRPLRTAAPLTRLIATLGLLAVLQGTATIRYGATFTVVPSSLPQNVVHVFGAAISVDRLWLLLIAAALTVTLFALARYTTLGLAMTATAENQRAAAALGWSPDVLAMLTWSTGAAVAAAAGILVAPIVGLSISTLTPLVIAGMAAALFANFTSFPAGLGAALIIGIAQSEMARYVTQPGVSDAAPFFLIMLVVVFRGRALPLRSQVLQRLPKLGSGVPRFKVILVASLALAIGMLTFFPPDLTIAVTLQLVIALILLSIVVLTGYAGQVSLAQFAMAGIGAYVAGRLVSAAGLPFALALVIGVAVAAPIGMIFALPALRTRGVNVAVVTLGLGLAVQSILFNNLAYTGGPLGTHVGPASFLGINLDPIRYPERYGVFCLVWFVLACLMVTNVRRSRVGRRLISVRTNERAAASLGINVAESKLFAFGLSSAMAGLGGILLAFQSYSIVYTSFDAISSVNLVGDTVIGGLGYASGVVPGSGFYPGGIGSYIFNHFASLDQWLILIGGVMLIITLLTNPDGIVGQFVTKPDPLVRWIRRQLNRGRVGHGEQATAIAGAIPPRGVGESAVRRVRPATLEVESLTVRFGGVVALDGVSLRVEPGEVVGLIGPNGAGKTTMIDSITGFVRPSAGSIRLGGASLDRLSAFRRARAGLSRSWQSLELFDDLTVLENLRSASDTRDRFGYLTTLVRAGNPPMPSAAVAAVEEFQLLPYLGLQVDTLPNGRRRLVSVARAVAAEPSILLLDEPAAGLDDGETREFAHLIRRLARTWGLGILLVEHDMSLVMSVCDRLVVLDFGKQIAEGTPAELRHNPAVIAAYLGEPRDDDETAVPADDRPARAGAGQVRGYKGES